jgi:adenine-specific DNA-methyltransferase
MGLLKEIFECRRVLYGYLKTSETFSPAHIKREIIQQNIYGVDLENGAVEIARLRFWLALVVDELEPSPLPNLDYKIMQGNSLLERFDDIDLSKLVSTENDDSIFVAEINQLQFDEGLAFPVQVTIFDQVTKETLYDLINQYFDTDEWEKRHHQKLDKGAIKRQINDIVEGKIHAHVLNEKRKLEYDISKYERKLALAQGGKINEKTKDYKSYLRQKERLARFDETESKLIDQQHSVEKPYFLWHLWFKDVFDTGGFDIVIGNPPYIQLQKIKPVTAILEKAQFQTFARTGDIYCLFYECGNELLKSGGALCFITSNQWMRASYGESLRKYLSKQNAIFLINLGPGIFPSATVDTNIFIGQKASSKKQLKGITLTNKEEITNLDKTKFLPMPNVNENAWTILNPLQNQIKEKLKNKGKQLKDWKLQIYRGILTGFNEAFLIDEEKRNELIAQDKKSAEIIKPILRGRDIQRFTAEDSKMFLINSHNGVRSKQIERINVKNFIAIKAHLENYWNEILIRADQGETPFNLRNCAYLDQFSKEKIIWKRIGSIMRFSYSDEEIYCLDSTCIATGEKIKYLTAFLNSKLGQYQLYENAPKTGMGDMIISVQALEPLFVYYPTEKEEQVFVNLVDYILFLKETGEAEKVNEYVPNSHLVEQFEEVIDAMVYELYFEEDFRVAEIEIIKYATRDFPPIEGLETQAKIEVIHNAYQTLRQKDNEIRNNLKLMDIRLEELIMPIKTAR